MAACAAIGGAAMLAAPAASLADGSLALSVGSQQVAGLPITYTVTGTSPAPDPSGVSSYELDVIVRPASFGPCGPDSFDDPSEQNGNEGASIIGGQQTQLGASQSFTYRTTIPGNLQGRGLDTLTSPVGPYLVCGWIGYVGLGQPGLVSTSASFSLRAPRFTMKLSAPSRPRLGRKGTFAVRGTSEISAHMTVEVLPACFALRNTSAGVRCAGRPLRSCKATPAAEDNYIGENNDLGIQAVTLISKEIPRGAFNLTRRVTFGGGWIPARHMVCAWLGITNTDGDADSKVYLAASGVVTPTP